MWEFGPGALRTVREQMISASLSRNVVNARVNRLRRVFKWGVENELVDPGVLEGLRAVAPVKAGRSMAHETSPVKPVPQEDIDVVVSRVTRPVKAMIGLRLVAGMRPGEVVLMRTCDIDMSGKIWEYRPESHKTEHHGIERLIFLGPRAQEIVRPFLKTDLTAYLFSPRDAVLDARKKLEPKKGRSKPTLRIRGYRRCPSEVYTRGAYQTAIYKACMKVGITPWGPNRLRHNAATFLRKEFGLEAARVILGHTSAAVTEIYAEIDRKKAAEIMGVAVTTTTTRTRRLRSRPTAGAADSGPTPSPCPPPGRCLVQRVSYVEFSTHRQCWYVREAQPASWLRRLLQALFGRPLGRTLHAAPSREQALHWEKQHFAPGGPGWKRMKSRRWP